MDEVAWASDRKYKCYLYQTTTAVLQHNHCKRAGFLTVELRNKIIRFKKKSVILWMTKKHS